MKKKIIIISAIAVVVIGAIIGSIFGLSSLFSADKGGNPSEESVLTSANEETDKKDGKTKITVGNAEGKKGSIVKVPVNISGNPGFTAALLNFKYDTSVVKYIGYEKGELLTDYEFADDKGSLKFLCLENKDVNKDGLLFNIKFEILKDSAETDIELSVEDVVNYNEKSVKTASTNGKITSK